MNLFNNGLGEEMATYKVKIYLQDTSAFGVRGMTIASETASEVKATLPRFQTAFIHERDEIGRIVNKLEC